jgi:hypothetical protein
VTIGAHLGREADSGTIGHVAASEPILARRQGPVLQNTWRHVGAHHAPYLDLKLVYRGTQSAGYRQPGARLGPLVKQHGGF